MGCTQQKLDTLDLAVQLRAKRHLRIRERLDHVHNQQGRTLTESELLPEAPLLKRLCIGEFGGVMEAHILFVAETLAG